jgi:hypothetical protein
MATSAAVISTSTGAIVPSSPSLSGPSIGNAITVHLSRDNFFLWRAQAAPVLRGHQLFGYVDGSIKAPAKTITEGSGDSAVQVANPEYARWYAQDQLVLSALVASMTEDMLGQMTQYSTAEAVWSALHAMFSSQNRAQIMQVRYQLSNAKKAGMSAAVYFQQMKGYADTMASLGHPLTDEEILGYMLAGLGAEYESLVTSITMCDDPISLNSFFAHLMSAEVHSQRNNSVSDIQSSANAVGRQPADPRGSPFARGGFGRGGQGCGGGGPGCGSGGRGRGGGKPTCQVCGRYGHDALHCRQRFNHVFQPDETRDRVGNTATSSYTVDTNWYMDSGANDHLTSDLDRLSLHERYTGKDNVQVANGSGLSISHIGHSLLPGSSRPLYLCNVLHVPGLSKHLLSAQKLAHDNNAFVELHLSFFCVKDQATQRILLHGRSRNGLYPVPCPVSSSCSPSRAALSSVTASADL